MSIIDKIQIGKVIIFNSMMFKGRWGFCIDAAPYDQVVYRGLFGLRVIDKKTFLGFARIVDIFDYIDHALTDEEKMLLKIAHRTGIMKSCKTVEKYVEKLFKTAKVKMFISPEGWDNEDITKR